MKKSFLKEYPVKVINNGVDLNKFKPAKTDIKEKYESDLIIPMDTFAKFIGEIENLEVEEQWTTSDVRPGRGEEKWLNLILRKI